MKRRSHQSWLVSLMVFTMGWGTSYRAYGALDDENLPTGPAKFTLPMIEEKKAAGATVEGKLLDDEISQLTGIIQNTPEGPSKADLLFRLSERHYEKSRALYYREMQEYDKVIKNWVEEREKSPDAAEPTIDNRKSQAAMKQALELSRALLARYKNYPRRDEVIFFMAYHVYQSDEKEAGLKMYGELIKEYPQSRFLPDALLAIGEHFFAKKDLQNARKAYERALTYKDSKASALALYKLAWCDYQVGNYSKAIDKLKQVVQRVDQESQQTTKGERNKTRLRQEALRDLVLAYTRINAIETAEDYYLKQIGEKGAFEYLRLLSLAYERQGKNELAIRSFRLLLNDYPAATDCPSFQNSIVQCFRKLNRRADVKREVNRLIEQYQPGSVWAEANKDDKAALQKAAVLVEESLRDTATTFSGNKNSMGSRVFVPTTKNADDALYTAMVTFSEAEQFDLAIASGKQLVKKYPSSNHLNSTIIPLANLYERIADFGSAATYYEMHFERWVAYRGKNHQGKLDDIARDKQAQEALSKAASLRESMGDYAKAINNYGKYIKYFSDTNDVTDQLYRVGLIYERLGKWRDADHIWEGYLQKYAGRSSATRVLNVIYNHALALHHSGKQKESDKFFNNLLDAYSKLSDEMRTSEIRHMISHGQFLKLEAEFNNFKTLKLVLPPSVLKHNLFVKIGVRSKLEKKYEEIVALQDPRWSLAALVRIGQINQNLSQSMYEAPISHDLTTNQQDNYVQELQKQALPFEEKATGCYQKVIAIAAAKGIYNEWLLQAQDLLRIYQPTVYPEPYKAKLSPTQRDALLDLGKLFTKETNYITAIESYKNALRDLQNDQRIMNNLIICYRLNRQYQEAEAIGYQLLAHTPDNIEAYNNMAIVFFDQGNYEMAVLFAIHAKKQLEQQRHSSPYSPEDAGIYNNLGLVYLKSGRPDEALPYFTKALEIKPDQLDALINIGALAHQYRDYVRAQVAYEKVLKLDPVNDTALRGLAYAVFGSGDAQRTIDLMNRLLARDPDEIKIYYVLGVVYDTFLHDFKKAIGHYERYIAKMGFALASNDPVKERLAAAKAKVETAPTAEKH